ncbi:MAG: thiolase family protein [Ruminococcaceae bacterium]|nr:thiolase family protein [Oscillospiraceae bacterium]
MKDVVIVEACRTAVGKFGGSLKPLDAEALAEAVIRGSLERSGLPAEALDEVIFGHCRQTSDYSNTARVAALHAGVPESVPANTVMCACASGMLAVGNAANSILTGQNRVVLAGGTESMTNAHFYLSNARWGVGTGTTQLKDSLTEAQFCSQPQDIYGRFNMGMTAENVAVARNISRADQDAFALRSQEKAAAAIAGGRFRDEIIPLSVPQGRKKDPIVFDTDEFPRQTSPEQLAKLKPAFQPDGGTVTAGNSSGRNDGASAMLLMSSETARQYGLKPLARVLGVSSAGVDPRYMGLGPVPATEKLLKRLGMTKEDLDLIELNEAFAAQSVACIRELGLEERQDIINVNGGAIALGHPIGSSGCRILVTLLHELRRREKNLGLATLCVAGGMGMAAVIETL